MERGRGVRNAPVLYSPAHEQLGYRGEQSR
jgi:hypothetical protein